MGHRLWTESSIGDPVTGISLEPEITKSTRSLWPARRIAASTPTRKATRSTRNKTDTRRYPRKGTDWEGGWATTGRYRLANYIESAATAIVDIRMETLVCGFSLREFANQSPAAILLRTPHGVVLGGDPWWC